MQKTKTVRGICLDLQNSNYKINISNFTFFFSSKFYLKKFTESYKDYVNVESLKITQKYSVSLNFIDFLLVSYYKKIEKRGFRVLYKNVEISNSCLFVANLWGDKKCPNKK